MNFLTSSIFKNEIALIEPSIGKSFTYNDLENNIIEFNSYFPKNKSLGFILCKNTYASIYGYLAAIQNDNSVSLIDASLDSTLLVNLISEYKPEWIWLPEDLSALIGYVPVYRNFGYKLIFSKDKITSQFMINEKLAVLLSTSGTTGSPKMVRLSYHNLQSNAASIVEYLEIKQSDRAITILPMQYSYGLSVINSHLSSGASIILTDEGVLKKEFWEYFKLYSATSLSGVPYTYQILKRLQFENMDLKSLKTMTQAGGRLDLSLQEYFAGVAEKKCIKFFIMYGQTEATARISYVPYSQLSHSIGSIGISIPGGRMEIDKETQELIYYGPNVMMGYANTREDLSLGDELGGRLSTGDLVRIDDKGFYYIIGRKKRFVKLFGLRINLDEVEKFVEKNFSIECYCTGDDNKIIIGILNESDVQRVKLLIADHYQLNHSAFKVKVFENIPRLDSGKVDYNSLKEKE